MDSFREAVRNAKNATLNATLFQRRQGLPRNGVFPGTDRYEGGPATVLRLHTGFPIRLINASRCRAPNGGIDRLQRLPANPRPLGVSGQAALEPAPLGRLRAGTPAALSVEYLKIVTVLRRLAVRLVLSAAARPVTLFLVTLFYLFNSTIFHAVPSTQVSGRRSLTAGICRYKCRYESTSKCGSGRQWLDVRGNPLQRPAASPRLLGISGQAALEPASIGHLPAGTPEALILRGSPACPPGEAHFTRAGAEGPRGGLPPVPAYLPNGYSTARRISLVSSSACASLARWTL